MRLFLVGTLASFIFLFSTFSISKADNPNGEVVPTSEIEWSPLNPARGDKSPQAGSLWGDRTQAGASGFLVKFVDGFESPPHIHNVTYRGVVISGLVHNDDPAAENMWLPAGSFWTQPAGEAHITAAKGQENIAYIEIDSGPYLVQPAAQAFDNGERPINVDPSNLVWLNASDVKWLDQADGVKVAFLWGSLDDGELSGRFVKLPTNFSGEIHSESSIFHAVVVQGSLQYDTSILNTGSYFGSNGSHHISSDNETIIYVRTNGKLSIHKN